MIPKILHYIWLGNEKGDLENKCIDSFYENMDDYEIIEWNESNIDLGPLTKSEFDFYTYFYEREKYAFCSDLIRLHILKKYGGIYVDTDVEFIKTLPNDYLNNPIIARINPEYSVCNGCILGCDKNDSLMCHLIELFQNKLNTSMKKYGKQWIFNTLLKDLFANNGDSLDNSKIVNVLNYNIYPTEYFCPINRITQEVCITNNTVSIHHFNSSWQR